jgi:hypothetical protein
MSRSSAQAYLDLEISAIEAVRAGSRLLLPDRSTYPELFAKKILSEKEGLLKRLREMLLEKPSMSHTEQEEVTSRYFGKPAENNMNGGFSPRLRISESIFDKGSAG